MRQSTLERAFQLAEQGPAGTLEEIRVVLKAEGYSDGVAHTSFASVRKQLRQIMQARLAASSGAEAHERGR